MNKYEALKHYFGYTSFRGGQEALIDSVLSGRDVLGIMPTGGGKSICYQIPALLFNGITIVVSPLISLMKDQVMALGQAGVAAAFLNSSLTPDQIGRVYRNLYQGAYKILYIAPERLDSDEFVQLMQQLPISLLAVDEAHCISQWGNDFRPQYLHIADFVETLPSRPTVAAFTATATEQVQRDIMEKLRLRSPFCLVTGFDRPNLNLEVLFPKNKQQALADILHKHPNKSGIIYCSTRNNVERICQWLVEKGFSATRYHAGLDDAERRQNQEDFIYDRKPIMVATNAFGMGIDKSNVNFVVHYNMPMSLEAYYQEAGRAGRDGEPADCILLYSGSDIQTAKTLIEYSKPREELSEEEFLQLRRLDYERLARMIDYCKTTDCLRKTVLSYFGQPHGDHCENCGNCRTVFLKKDITREAQMILSCVKRIHDHLGYSLGASTVALVLKGSNDQRILSLGLDRLSTYGLMKERTRNEIHDLINHLEKQEYLFTDPLHRGILLCDSARQILFEGKTVTMEYKEIPKKESRRQKRQRIEDTVSDKGLYERLRLLRSELANQQRVPAYVIFSNATLADMAVKQPMTVWDLMDVSGVGRIKAEQYGELFLREIRRYVNGN